MACSMASNFGQGWLLGGGFHHTTDSSLKISLVENLSRKRSFRQNLVSYVSESSLSVAVKHLSCISIILHSCTRFLQFDHFIVRGINMIHRYTLLFLILGLRLLLRLVLFIREFSLFSVCCLSHSHLRRLAQLIFFAFAVVCVRVCSNISSQSWLVCAQLTCLYCWLPYGRASLQCIFSHCAGVYD